MGKKTTPKKRNTGSADWSVSFLAALSKNANVKQACLTAKIARPTAYRRKESDPEFAAAWQNALDDAVDELEKVAHARAKKSSDTLLIFLLKSHRPEVYRERSEVKVSGDVKTVTEVIVRTRAEADAVLAMNSKKT